MQHVGQTTNLGRRAISIQTVMLMLGGATITLSGCGGSSDTTPSTTDSVGVITGNHGHEAVIMGGQLLNGSTLVLDIKGTGTHTHTLELTSDEVTSARSGAQVVKTSSVAAGHSHVVTFNLKTATADKTGTIASNHGHVAVITAAQLNAAATLTLDIQGTSTHTHSLDLTADEISKIRGGGQVVKTSTTTANHSHSISFN